MKKALCGVALVLGGLLLASGPSACAAGTLEGDGESGTDGTASDPDRSRLPPSASPRDDAGAGQDAKADASPPAPAPGQSCTTVDQVFTRTCGACGTQSALCFSSDGGAGIVSEYNPCSGEVQGGCTAGTAEELACGNCGTQKRKCTTSCVWSVGSCVEPAAACKAGTVEYSPAGCASASTYRMRTCQGTCAWTPYSACAAPMNETVIDVAGTVAQTTTLVVNLSASQMAAGLEEDGTCPVANLVAGSYPFRYVELRNPTAKVATVAISISAATTAEDLEPLLTTYTLPIVPVTQSERLACAAGPTDFTVNVTIPVGQSILVYVSSYYEYEPSYPSESTGDAIVAVRTVSLL